LTNAALSPDSSQKNRQSSFYTVKSPFRLPQCMRWIKVSLMQTLLKSKIAPAAPSLVEVKEFADKTEKLFAEHGVSPESKLVGIIPGARWHSKCWPPAFFADIINAAHRLNPEFKFLILGSKSDRQAADEIINRQS
jgi:ADP-heptose:LPS heptosyltransferase